jgi:hypothetical protein
MHREMPSGYGLAACVPCLPIPCAMGDASTVRQIAQEAMCMLQTSPSEAVHGRQSPGMTTGACHVRALNAERDSIG